MTPHYSRISLQDVSLQVVLSLFPYHVVCCRYICCNGTCPCSGRCGEQKNPQCCLCLEVTCCFAQSVAATRWLIQDELRLQTTSCDNCIIGTSERLS